MMNRLLRVLCLICMSCEVVVDIDVPTKPSSLTINSVLNPDSLVSVVVTASQHILSETEFQLVEGATVTLYDNGEFLDSLSEMQPGFYVSQHRPIPSHKYSVEVKKESFATVFSETRIPASSPDISEVTYRQIGEPYDSEQLFNVSFYDPPGRNFYELLLYQQAPHREFDPETGRYEVVDTIYVLNYINSNDPVLAESSGYFGSLYFSDALVDGQQVTLNFETYVYGFGVAEDEGIKVKIVLRELSESLYRYKASVALQSDLEGDPFSEPVPAYNNIENGFGVFGGYVQKYLELIVVTVN